MLAGIIVVMVLDAYILSMPTDGRFFGFFNSNARSLRQHPVFHKFVLDVGLLDYWKKWGWSEYCEPVGDDDFRCD